MAKGKRDQHSGAARSRPQYMKPQVLLVDDDEAFREEFIEYFGEYDFIEAATASQAAVILKKPNRIIAVLLDVMLPDARGTALLQSIRELNPGTKVIILTGFGSKDMAVEALRAHADDYMEKPLNTQKAREILTSAVEGWVSQGDGSPGLALEKIERVKRFIQNNAHKKICLADAAAAVFLSPKYLSRVFKERTGVGFSEYCLHVKTEQAKRFLSETGLNINQVAEKMGYENAESFIRMFSRITGSTPTQYRRSMRLKRRTRMMVRKKRRSKRG